MGLDIGLPDLDGYEVQLEGPKGARAPYDRIPAAERESAHWHTGGGVRLWGRRDDIHVVCVFQTIACRRDVIPTLAFNPLSGRVCCRSRNRVVMEFQGDLAAHLPVPRLPAGLEPVVRRTLAGRDRLHLFERHRYRAAAAAFRSRVTTGR